MIRWISQVLFACIGVVLLSGVTLAQPDPTLSTCPSVLHLSPIGPGGPLALFPATYTIIDMVSGLPIRAATVTIDMTGCDGLFPGPGDPAIGLVCGPPGALGNVASGVTDAAGMVTFVLTGFAINPGGGAPGAVSACARVLVSTDVFPAVAFPSINIAAPDQNGAGGVNPADGTLFLADRDLAASPKNQARSDFNGSGVVNPADGAFILAYLFGGPTATAPAVCP